MKSFCLFSVLFVSFLFGSFAAERNDLSCSQLTFEPRIQSLEDAQYIYKYELIRRLYCQDFGYQCMNGEGTMKTMYNNMMGNDFQNYGNWYMRFNTDTMSKTSSSYCFYIWHYYYTLIMQSNILGYELKEASNISSKIYKSYEAHRLTILAYSYLQLVNFYCDRWSDSNDGATTGIPITEDIMPINNISKLPAESLKNVYAYINTLLDKAIEIFLNKDYKSTYFANYYSDECFLLNLEVAYAIKAKAALQQEKWEEAATFAKLARKGKVLMSNEEYFSGFNSPNQEWIWGINSETNIFYYSFFAYQGSNVNSSACRENPCMISKDLIDCIPDTDIRKKQYLIPTENEFKMYGIDKASGSIYQRAINDYSDKLWSTSKIYPYMQFKFQCAGQPGDGSLNIIRAAEMYLIEAESYYHLGEFEKAQKTLEELNTPRNPYYICDKTGLDLLNEIRLYRRFELWGEGFNWSDYKRWNLPIVRKGVEEGGNYRPEVVKTIQPEENNGWKWSIPDSIPEADFEELTFTTTINGLKYRIYKMKKYAELINCDDNVSNINLPDAIVCGEARYPLTTIKTGSIVKPENIKSLYISSNIESIDSELLKDCSELSEITVSLENKNYKVKNGILFDSTRCLFCCRSIDGEVEINEDVEEISPYAFMGCNKLTRITLPSKALYISKYSFSGCSSLEDIVFPDSLYHIAPFAFENCRSIKTLNFEGKKKFYHIYEGAFKNCSSLTSITFPNNDYLVCSGEAFTGTALKTVFCNQKTSPYSEIRDYYTTHYDPFYRLDLSNSILYVPYGTKQSYEENQFWSGFDSIIEIDFENKDFENVTIVSKDTEITDNNIISIPLYLENNPSSINSIEFDIILPEEISLNQDLLAEESIFAEELENGYIHITYIPSEPSTRSNYYKIFDLPCICNKQCDNIKIDFSFINIVLAANDKYVKLPNCHSSISITMSEQSGIEHISVKKKDSIIYNYEGMIINKINNGFNIVDGGKIFIK